MDLKLIRGDTYVLTFSLKGADGQPYILNENDMCYFTVKKTFRRDECILQKRLGNGITYNAASGLYEIKITQLCTCDFSGGDYVYDIKVKIGGNEIVKTLIIGKLILEDNATHRGNEL